MMLQVAQEPEIAVLDTAAAESVATSTAPPQGIERVMLAEDKLPVVLAVVLIVWAGILFLLLRTERRLGRIERHLDAAEHAVAERTGATDQP